MQKLVKRYWNDLLVHYSEKGQEEKASYLLGEYVLGIMEAQSGDDFTHFVDNDKTSIAFVRGWMDWNSCKKEGGNE